MNYDQTNSSRGNWPRNAPINRYAKRKAFQIVAYLLVFCACVFLPATPVFAGSDNGSGGGNPPAQTTVQFGASKFRAAESDGTATISVTRTGVMTNTVSVDYSVGLDDDKTASATQRADFILTAGTLTFAPNETIKSFTILLNKVRVSAPTIKEVKLVLLNVKGTNAALGNPSRVSFEIENNDVRHENETENPIDDHGDFVRQHYHDFLNREPDAGGLAFWRKAIDDCGTDAPCLDRAQINVSAAFFISREFQNTGFVVYKMEKVAFNRRSQYANFLPQVQKISRDMIEQNVETSRRQFADDVVERPEFHTKYDALTNDQFVDQLYRNAEITPDSATRNQQITDLNTGRRKRGDVLRDIVENNQQLTEREYNKAFVLMQYFGYLRRDSDEAGYQFWVRILEGTAGNERNNYPGMVQAFIKAIEYRDRFNH